MTLHDELAEAHDWLETLTSGALTLRGSHGDITQQYEIGVAKREIAFLEKVLARSGNEPPDLI
ncbi:MAG: hypothetical protein ACLQF1_01865 [Methyloceanibacter sp.]